MVRAEVIRCLSPAAVVGYSRSSSGDSSLPTLRSNGSGRTVHPGGRERSLGRKLSRCGAVAPWNQRAGPARPGTVVGHGTVHPDRFPIPADLPAYPVVLVAGPDGVDAWSLDRIAGGDR
jgi:hypothetical protein